MSTARSRLDPLVSQFYTSYHRPTVRAVAPSFVSLHLRSALQCTPSPPSRQCGEREDLQARHIGVYQVIASLTQPLGLAHRSAPPCAQCASNRPTHGASVTSFLVVVSEKPLRRRHSRRPLKLSGITQFASPKVTDL